MRVLDRKRMRVQECVVGVVSGHLVNSLQYQLGCFQLTDSVGLLSSSMRLRESNFQSMRMNSLIADAGVDYLR